MTKRFAGFAVAAAAAVAFGLPAAPASASHCINMGTTPVECTLARVDALIASCIQGTQVTCLPASG